MDWTIIRACVIIDNFHSYDNIILLIFHFIKQVVKDKKTKTVKQINEMLLFCLNSFKKKHENYSHFERKILTERIVKHSPVPIKKHAN